MVQTAERGRTSVIQQDSRGDTSGPSGVLPEATRPSDIQNGASPDRARLSRAVPPPYRERAKPAVPPLRRGPGLNRAYGGKVSGLDKGTRRVATSDGQERPLPPFHCEGDGGQQGEVRGLLAILRGGPHAIGSGGERERGSHGDRSRASWTRKTTRGDGTATRTARDSGTIDQATTDGNSQERGVGRRGRMNDGGTAPPRNGRSPEVAG